MDNTKLYLSFWENTQDSLGKSFKVISTCNQYILKSKFLKVGKYLKLEIGTFTLRDIHPQNFLISIFVNTQHTVERPMFYLPIDYKGDLRDGFAKL